MKIMLKKSLLSALVVGVLAGCSGESDQSTTEKVDEHPATGSFNESTKPKKIASKPCSNYNLKFYEGDERVFKAGLIRLGSDRSDAKVEINGRKVAILGFRGQAEEYINYSMYRGISHDKKIEKSGSTVTTTTETQIIICFRKKVIAVKQLIENVRARGALTKSKHLTKQWIWKVED
ncbi:MAG: hypothetical protein MJK04_10270 [Psychrosphaera sp.]|nr:hypothetical protein [Psychrosphaera sp.]